MVVPDYHSPLGEPQKRSPTGQLVHSSLDRQVVAKGYHKGFEEPKKRSSSRRWVQRHLYPYSTAIPPASQVQMKRCVITQPSDAQIRQVEVPPFGRQSVRTYRIGTQGHENLQLSLRMEAEFKDGTTKLLQVLVDTGAQANLVRAGLVPSKFLHKAQDPLQLLSANGEVISGGDQETTLRLHFNKTTQKGKVEKRRNVTGLFYTADIGVDAILSYPWLRDAKIGIFPHLNSLALPHPEQVLLQPTIQPKDVKASFHRNGNVRHVSKIPQKKKSDFWITERYQVRPEIMQRILGELGESPSLDLFADSQTHVFPRWLGEGGEHSDAFKTSWEASKVGTTWANPPFSMLECVIHKIVDDEARTLLICPDWKNWKWWKAAQPLIEKQVFIPKGTKVFQSPEREKVPPSRWGVWAYVLNGTLGQESWHKLWKKFKSEKKRPQACVSMFTVRPNSEPEDERIEEFRRIIFKDFEGTVLTSHVSHDPPKRGPYGEAKILLKEGAIPVRQKVFGVHGERAAAHKQVTQEWLDNGYLELAEESEWLSMTFPVPKKNPGEWRGVVDMRGPNEHTRTSNYPLPVIERLLVIMGAKQIFSILDLKQAFHQQPLEKSSRPITACWTPLGVFQWKVNVMGLKNAPNNSNR